MLHYSVMLNESIEGLNIHEDGVYVDCTLGYAGHSGEILKRIPKGHLYAFDQDEEAIKYSKDKLASIADNYTIIHSNFFSIKEKLNELGITQVDGIIFDLGLSSPQIDNKERGFTFMNEALLDMRMDLSKPFNARNVVNEYTEAELTNIFYSYGEEAMSKNIARKIVEVRKNKKIETTTELVNIILSAVGARYFNQKHPERQIFQAIRIEVNNELNILRSVLPDAIDLLKKGGRISVITFHSLEDRIVKQVFKQNSEVPDLFKGLPDIPKEYLPKIKLVNKHPLLPSDKELSENTRSKSAKLRIIERL